MRVLLLHNRYRAEGGEERAVADIAALLHRRGDQVEVLERSSGEASRARAARGLLSGGLDPDDVSGVVRASGAEVVHAHNVHPLLGWRALAAARAAGARVVLHVHNFRLFCAIGVAYRDGSPCFRCHHGRTLPGLRLRCRGSLGEAAVYAIALARQQPRLLEHADRLVTVSHATAAKLRELGVPHGKLEVLANFVAAERFAADSMADRGSYALASGRLVEEKGFDLAISAASAAKVPLMIAGSGPDEGRLRSLAAGADVRFTGMLKPQQLDELRRGAGVVLVPSRSDEACPYAALDAMAAGVPVLASDRGGLPELIDECLPAGHPDAWREALLKLWSNPKARLRRGRDTLARARERLSEERYYAGLARLYGFSSRSFAGRGSAAGA